MPNKIVGTAAVGAFFAILFGIPWPLVFVLFFAVLLGIEFVLNS